MAIVQPTDFENIFMHCGYKLHGGNFSKLRRIKNLILPGPFIPTKVVFTSRLKLLRKSLGKAAESNGINS